MRQLLNLANQLTLFRLAGIPIILIAILYGRHGLALGLFLAAGVTDAIDGVVARRLNQRTMLGAFLDPIADKLLLCSSFVVLSLVQSVPWWVTILVLSRDIIIVATTVAVVLATPIRTFPPSSLGKWNTTFQIAAVFAVLLRNAWRNGFTVGAAAALLWLTVVFTVASGVHYAGETSRVLARHGAAGSQTAARPDEESVDEVSPGGLP